MQLYSSLLITEYTVSVYWTVASDLDSWSLFVTWPCFTSVFGLALILRNDNELHWCFEFYMLTLINDIRKWAFLRRCGHVNLPCITIQMALITDAFQHDRWRISTFWLTCNMTLLFTHFHSRWVSSTARLNGKCRFYCPFTDRPKN